MYAVTISPRSGVRHLALTGSAHLRMEKTITFVITVVSMLLVFGLERGLSRYQPSAGYLLVAALYYAASERQLTSAWQAALERLCLPYLDCLEELWPPLLLAEPAELRDMDDVCAVCLAPMREACVTPYHHLFHSSCLRRCLQVTDRCAICARDLDSE
ncbi:uncharacterized protein LOC119108846 [Pollicipes pollicipes]|uniref:uncharacterized protein LOC119108846 n=1 Tax=Pollicipes pollicipes TaxID=41117 RepID=UPI001884B4A3|nr:uncharacterized protein LOC119108846 [Pollicipes pollicipes]